MSTETRRFGKYELRERLGEDEMVEVWKAFDTQAQRYVVVKFPHANLQNDTDFLKRFEREAKVTASLHHPNLVQIYDAQVSHPPQSESTIPYIVMGYIEGQTLADYIGNTSRIGNFPPIADIIHIFTAISSAVDYAHQKGMIYCNVKPANILLDKHNTSRSSIGEPILTNFEVPTLLGNSSHTGIGTASYISPEQARGYPGNERSDIYSLGAILYEICTGVPPFQGGNPVDIMMQQVKASPTPPEVLNRYIPPALSEVILQSLAKDPMARFPNASAMAAALVAAFNMSVSVVPTRPTPTPSSPSLSSLPTKKRRNPFLTVLIALLLLLLLVGSGLGAFAFFNRSSGPVAADQLVGNAYLESSGQFVENSTNGINDELHLVLHSVSSPAPGKSYYLWLLSDIQQKPLTFIALGTVQVNHGNVNFTYTTPQHTNLVATTSRLLITEESTNPAPSSFSSDPQTWRYYAEISQRFPSPDAPYLVAIKYLRYLLFESNKLAVQGLHGGHAIRMLRNTQKVLEWASSARDEWDLNNFSLMHRHFIRILDYIDGSAFVSADLPPGTPLLVNPLLAQNGLVTVVPGENPEAYLPRAAFSILSFAEAGNTLSPEKRQLAFEVEKDIRVNLASRLELVRQDAKQLVAMTDAQLAQRSTLPLLNDLLTQANYAYAGQFDPATGNLQGGALNDYNLIQAVASFDIYPCPGSQCTVK